MDSSNLWVYQSNKILIENDIKVIENELRKFLPNWKSHGSALDGEGFVYMNRFLILTVSYASGCSIDQSVAFVKSLGLLLNVDFFDRMLFTFENKNSELETIHFSMLDDKIAKKEINENTFFFDTLIKTKQEFETSFKKKVGESWLKSKLELIS
jgi:hypothetical protein